MVSVFDGTKLRNNFILFSFKSKNKVYDNVLLGGWTGRDGLKVAAWVIYYRVAVGDDGGTRAELCGATPFRMLDLGWLEGVDGGRPERSVSGAT